MFQVARLNVRNMLATAKLQYYSNNIKECKGNHRTVVNKVLHLNQTVVSKLVSSSKVMAHDFNNLSKAK